MFVRKDMFIFLSQSQASEWPMALHEDHNLWLTPGRAVTVNKGTYRNTTLIVTVSR